MKPFACALAGLGLLTAVQTANADDSTVLIDLCKQYAALPAPTGGVTSEYIQLKSSCAGFLGSTIRLSRPDDGICRPDKFNIDELVKPYLDWTEKHPDQQTHPTRETIMAAFADVYPCPK